MQRGNVLGKLNTAVCLTECELQTTRTGNVTSVLLALLRQFCFRVDYIYMYACVYILHPTITYIYITNKPNYSFLHRSAI